MSNPTVPHVFGEDDLPSTLWHYTTAAGLHGILDRRVLWGSHVRYMNDEREFRHVFDVAVEILEQLWSKWPEEADGAVEEVGEILREPVLAPCFAVSFSAERDALSQWRGYGGGGQSYAIGFDPAGLRVTLKWILRKCSYDLDALRDALRPIVVDAVRRAGRGMDFEEILIDDLSEYATYCKHPAFAEEKEWRLISMRDDSGIKTRVTSRGLVPYREFMFTDVPGDDTPVSSILVGPGGDDDSKVAVRYMLRDRTSTEVCLSDVPYRQ
ncbi:DUF2971 domain-containing protein [Rathayibacter sp. VKM Ac-2805]|uniref:DUF2971 domain-containing protein n=1 Tax=Rathayibacter sp. VKM Ac-2805 TaxID=2609258 RepID=UPI00131FFEC6|nr:DUF2971 domain-containing protein [Rathayibacter sp. VKM Ac-2805]QHC73791.1 DUF2971 domain-containing protein [Rathayibacter sp. VKM Ac-2805]